MADLLEILGGLSGQPPQQKLNLAPTPAQVGFNPDEQKIRELLLTLGADVAGDQSPEFLTSGGFPPPAPAAIPTPQVNQSFADQPVQLPPQTEQSFIAKLLGFPGAGEPDIAGKIQQGVSAVQPTLRDIFEPGSALPEQPALVAQPSEVPPLLARPEEQGQGLEGFIGTTMDDITTGKFEVKPENVIVPATEAIGMASPEHINSVLSGEADEVAIAAVEKSFFDAPGMQDLFLGVGISLMQGKGIGDAMATGVAMMKQSQASGASAKGKAATALAELDKTKAETGKLVAETTKLGREAGLDKEALKGFRNTFKTLVGEQGIGDEVGTLRAKAEAANTELAGSPKSKPLLKLRDDSIAGILTFISNLEDEEEQKDEINKLKQSFGDTLVQGMIDNF